MLESYVEARDHPLESLEDLQQLIFYRKNESATKTTQELISNYEKFEYGILWNISQYQ